MKGSKNVRPSGLPVRASRISVMSSTRRTECSTDAANNNNNSSSNNNNCSYPRDKIGSPRSRLGNITNARNVPDFKKPNNQNPPQPSPKSIPKRKCSEAGITGSVPDLSKLSCTAKRAGSVPSVIPKAVPKTQSAENLHKIETNFKGRGVGRSTIPKSISTGTFRLNELRRVKKENLEQANKRKFICLEPGSSKMKDLMSPNVFSPPPPKNLMEDCAKIVKKILLEKRITDVGESKRSSSEFDESIGTFNSDEIMDLFGGDLPRKRLESGKDLEKSSKRNSSEFEDSIGSFFSDHMGLNFSKSNEFLNLKQSLCNENQLALSISEGMDNLTPGFSDLSNAIDHTPSVEDLPMECEGESGTSTTPGPEPNTNVSARSPSPTDELPLESLSSRTPNAPVSIITSITSIMSLDTGYQGDGELSRPESRNAETELRLLKLPQEGLQVKGINFDDGKTMTDSDFFTESDADVHDDLSAAAAEIGSGKGDRKAQVIDGTLYGGGNSQSQSEAVISENLPKSLGIVPNSSNEDMESSGIYSDFEKKEKPETPKSEEKEPTSYLGLITEQMKTIQKYIKETKFRHDEINEGMVKSSSGESSSTIQENPSSVKVSPSGSTKTIEALPIERKDTVKKNKMPNRNVSSKIKALIESPKQETEAKPKTVKKGKWDAVMDKIAQGKEENKYTPSRFRDIKSKVFQNVAPLFNPKKSDGLDSEGSQRTSSNSSLKGRSRRSTRVRSSESSLVSPKLKQSRKATSPNSSQRSSLSDISVSTASHQNKNVTRASKKRDSCSPQSNASTNSGNTPTRQAASHEVVSSTPSIRGSFRHSDIQNGNVIRPPNPGTTVSTMKTPPVRKAPTPRRNEIVHSLQRTPSAPLKDSNQNGIVNKSASASTITAVNNNNNNNKIRSLQGGQNRSPRVGNRPNGPAQPRNQSSLTAAKENAALLNQLKHCNKAFESLAVLFKYCTNDLDAFSTPLLKRNLEEMQITVKRLQEEIRDKDHLITDLKNDNTSLCEEGDKFKKLTESLRLEENDLKSKLSSVQEELKIISEQKNQAESELLKEIERIRCLKREISERTEKFQIEKDGLICRLQETEKANGVLKSANSEIKAEYDKCLSENQKLVNVCSKMRNEKVVKEPPSVPPAEEKGSAEIRCQNGDVERSPERIPLSPQKQKTPVVDSLYSTPDRLESEVKSLQAVLALKTNQVTDLRRQLLLVQESADRVQKLGSTITMLEGKVEDLQTQLSSQTETVRELYKHNDHLEEELKSANIQKTRLAHKNEELQYKLKQYAEAMKQMVNHKNLSEGDIKSFNSILKTPRREEENLDDTVRSQMIGVVEKSDSVSYMLEMTEDTSEIVSTFIRRAESMRSSSRGQTLPKKKRSKTSSISSTDTDFSVGTPNTPKRLEGFSLSGENFHPNMISTPTLSPTSFDFDDHTSFGSRMLAAGREENPTMSPIQYSMNKTVKLNQNDFATDSIELATDNDCEIIEITRSFDKTDKNPEMVTSTSSSLSSSSNGSHFDIESDICSNLDNDQNIQEMDENTESSEVQENGGIIRTFRREAENIKPVLPIYKDIDANEDRSIIETGESDAFLTSSKSFIKIPKISGGEAMIGLSSDDEEIDKIK